MSPRRGEVDFTTSELSLVFIALHDLRDQFPETWPDDVKAAALKASSLVARNGNRVCIRGGWTVSS